jgi:uncharacterized protein (TIGR02145 family)
MTTQVFVDPRDGEEYRVVRMRDGRQWFAQNLRFVAPGSLAAPPRSDAPADVADRYDPIAAGRTYHFEAADPACPPGWHLPTYAEWSTMLKKYGEVETREWMGNSKLRTQTVELIQGDGFNPVGTAIGDGANPNAGYSVFKDSSLSCRFWVKDCVPNIFGKSKPAPFQIKGSAGEIANAAYFVCFTDNVYIHAESISFWYSVRCIEN